MYASISCSPSTTNSHINSTSHINPNTKHSYLAPLLAFFHAQLEQEYSAPDAQGIARPSLPVFCTCAAQFLSNASSCPAYEEPSPEQVSV